MLNNKPPTRIKEQFSKRPNKAPWWDDNCSQLVRERRTAANVFLKNPTHENLEKLNKIETNTKNKLRLIKKTKFKTFVSETLSRNTDIKTIWNVINCFKNIANQKASFPNNDTEILQNAHNFIQEYCQNNNNNNNNYNPNQQTPSFSSDNDSNSSIELDSPFNIKELNLSINAANSNSSPGLDQID